MALKVAIAGAGIGGLTAALALARNGHAVELAERAEAPRETGAGLQLSPNAMKVLAALGLGAAIGGVAVAPRFAAIRHWRSGAWLFAPRLGDVAAARYGAPYLHVHRADLHRILLEAARAAGARIRTGITVTGAAQDGREAWLLSGTGAIGAADLAIGADGLRSAVQASLLGQRPARYTGQVAWRALVPATDCAAPPDPGATVWIGPGRHLVTYRVRGGELVNVVAVEERRVAPAESWTAAGDPGALHAAFGDWHPDASQLVARIGQCHLWALYDRATLPVWSRGRIGLLGDACHPTLPFMAQGAALAIEDAALLARALERHGVVEALQRFEAHRKPRATRLQAIARANARLYHLTGGPGDALRRAKLAVARSLPSGAQLAPLDRIYGYDATRAKF